MDGINFVTIWYNDNIHPREVSKVKGTLTPLAMTVLTIFCLGAGPALAQNGVKTRVTRDGSGHATIVIHDTRAASATAKQDASERAFQAREAELQRRHELELARIQADTQVRIAALRQPVAAPTVAQAPAPTVVTRRDEVRPSYRNGGQFTGFSPVFFGGFSPYGFYGGGFPGYGGGGGYRCAPAPRVCR